ncbi:MAG: helix-turn-helix transcriptional regulator [Flavobacteriales bacterium]|nr:helix-turn-helix transcriptional regulator [Flavobacteriales bacterium]MCB9448115.1 helix-turn-helix transcriptional regulator [Flavobacteriales bacterium]
MEDKDWNGIRLVLRTLPINRIKECIEAKGMSQAFVARQMNKTCNTLNGWCSNKCQPHLVDLYLLATILDCEVHDLLVPMQGRQIRNAARARQNGSA